MNLNEEQNRYKDLYGVGPGLIINYREYVHIILHVFKVQMYYPFILNGLPVKCTVYKFN